MLTECLVQKMVLCVAVVTTECLVQKMVLCVDRMFPTEDAVVC